MRGSRPLPKPKPVAQPRRPIGREAWIDAAQVALTRRGSPAVSVALLARRLRVSPGSFYRSFKNLRDLRDELVRRWLRTATAPFVSVLSEQARNGMQKFDALAHLWIEEKVFNPAWDCAMRDWARADSRVARAVKRVDVQRIGILTQIFRDLGYGPVKAETRARVTYFHQVGYYALGICESSGDRLERLPFYIQALTGRSAGEAKGRPLRLSPRQQQIVHQLSLGNRDKAIAKSLILSVPTVNFHLRQLYRKLGVRNRAAAVTEARRRGWLD
jgi:DNA-binding CsgD family transcriptional regulator